MLSYHYRLHCTTPAFLGNAEQSGQWRTPPIKALLRQWWRVAYVADQTRPVSVDAMRAAEGRLFGTASDDREGGSSKSLVRIRLEDWGAGKLTNWQELDLHKVAHPEFKRQGKVVPIGAQLYLGYGPLDSQGGGTVLKKANAAIQANQSTELRLACLDNLEAPRLRHALWLIQQYGTLGGRSRNGWGSLVLTPVEQTPAFDAQLDPRACMPWRDALQADWPRAIGSDEQGPLI